MLLKYLETVYHFGSCCGNFLGGSKPCFFVFFFFFRSYHSPLSEWFPLTLQEIWGFHSVRINHSFWLLVESECYPLLSFWVVLSLSWFPHTEVLICTLLSTQQRLSHIPREPSLCSAHPSIAMLCKLPTLLFLISLICLLEILLSKFKSHTFSHHVVFFP